jgi:transcription elongation factor GreB
MHRMSKAFTKDDAPDEPVVIPSRAPLPPGVPNYVTARGMALLKLELSGLEGERARLEASKNGDDTERRHRIAVLAARIAELSARVLSAEVIEHHGQPPDEVRFGATVTLRPAAGEQPFEERHYQIVGVDEANVASGRVAFVAPIARALLGKRVGDVASVHTARGDEDLEIVAIEYQAH